jgi:hypothetical protein
LHFKTPIPKSDVVENALEKLIGSIFMIIIFLPRTKQNPATRAIKIGVQTDPQMITQGTWLPFSQGLQYMYIYMLCS